MDFHIHLQVARPCSAACVQLVAFGRIALVCSRLYEARVVFGVVCCTYPLETPHWRGGTATPTDFTVNISFILPA